MTPSGPVHSTLPPNTTILIVASNASTRFGGEAVLPVHYFRLLKARGWRVNLIAHERNRDDLAETFGEACENITFIEDTAWHKVIWQAGRPFPEQIRQFLFGTLLGLLNEFYQGRIIRQMVRDGLADLIHQPMPVSPRTPSSVHGFGVPVIIGPMNGDMKYPPGYEDFESHVERYFVPAARALSRLANRAVPGKRKAATLLVANDRTRAALPVEHGRVITLIENGVSLDTFTSSATIVRPPQGTLRLVFMGRLIALKGVDFTLRAIACARQRGNNIRLDILGDGPERSRLEDLANSLGLGAHTTFHGFIPQKECAAVLNTADALILNSLRECGGAVILEAMSVGLPVIASDWGGPADYIDSDTGILVPPAPRESFANRLADAISQLADDPDLRQRMGQAGARKVQDTFDWNRKIDRILDIYADALGKTPSDSRLDRPRASRSITAGD